MTKQTGIPKWVFWTVPVIAVMAVVAAVVINWAESSMAQLPSLGQVPQFKLTERNGQTITANDLQGHLTVVDFIFTSCRTICPVMTGNMSDLYQTYKGSDKVHFLSISVDPDVDSLTGAATLRCRSWRDRQSLVVRARRIG